MKDWDIIKNQLAAYQIDSIQFQTVLLLLLIAAVIFSFFYVFRRYIGPFLGSRKAVKKSNLLRYRLEVITWCVYSLFGIYQLLTDSMHLTVIFLFIVILAGRNFWRDLFSGIAFKIENKFELNDPVRFEDYKGILDKIGTRNIQIKTDSEELVVIPFRKLSNSLFIKRQAKGKLHSAKLTLKIVGVNPDEVILKINDWLYQCPWAVMNEKVSAKVVSPTEISVTVYAIDKFSINKTETYLQKKLNKL